MVMLESAVVGVIASMCGVLFSLGIARLMLFGRNYFGGGVPDHALVVTADSVVVGLVVGTATTVLAGLLPHGPPAGCAPLSALSANPEAVTELSLAGRAGRVAGAGVVAFLGVLAIAAGTRRGEGFAGTPLVLGGAMMIFVAIVAVLPLVVGRLAGTVGWLPSQLLGVTARLATSNARRNPRRASAITTALMIGVALMSMFTVILATLKVQRTSELAENFPVDFVIDPATYGRDRGTCRKGWPRSCGRAPSWARSSTRWRPRRGSSATGRPISAVRPEALGTEVTPEIMRGSLADLKPHTVALRLSIADGYGLDIGDPVSIGWGAGEPYRVVAIYDDAPVRGNALLLWSDFEAAFGADGSEQILVRRAAGVDADRAHAALDTVLAKFPLVTVTSSAEQRDALNVELDKRQAQFGGLLGMSILIALLGIMNTLALSVLERTRESATLRAMGVSARQLRRMLVLEALILAAGRGGHRRVLRHGCRLGHGEEPDQHVRARQSRRSRFSRCSGTSCSWPSPGMVAAVLPARRATRASITAAMADT